MFNLRAQKNLPIYDLTPGERQRFKIVVALFNKPKCLFLDLSAFELD